MSSPLSTDCRLWIRATRRPFVTYFLALLIIAISAKSRSGLLVGIALVVLLVASIWVGHTIRGERRRATYRVGLARLVVAVMVGVVSVALMFLSRLHPILEIPAFAGLGMLVVSIGGLISEARRYRRWEHVRGPVALGVAFVSLAAALIFHPKSGLFIVVVVLSLVLANLGTELHSEDRLRSRPEWNPLRVAALGALMMVIGVGLLVSWGAGPVGGMIFALVVLALVSMATSDSDSLLVVVVIAFALIWASAPRVVGPDPELEAHKDASYYLVVGDSYISGEGAQRYYEGTNTSKRNEQRTNTCRRAPTAWAVRLAAKHTAAEVPRRVLFIPCSGAVGANIRATAPLDRNGAPRGPAELEEFGTERVKRGLKAPSFVLVSVGGNDAEFGTIGKTCVGPGDCAEVGDMFFKALAKVEEQLDATYRDLRAAVGPDVPVVAVPYPIPVSDSGRCPDVFLGETERKFVVQFVRELNAVVESAATRGGFAYMNTMETALTKAGKRLCDGPSGSGLNFLNWNPQAGNLWQSLTPTNWTHNSLHPNEGGHEAMREAADEWFQTNAGLRAGHVTRGPHRTVRSVDQMLEFGATKLCTVQEKEACGLGKNDWLYEQGFRLVSSSFLAIVLAATGAWMLAMAPIRYATEHNISSATIILRIIRFVKKG